MIRQTATRWSPIQTCGSPRPATAQASTRRSPAPSWARRRAWRGACRGAGRWRFDDAGAPLLLVEALHDELLQQRLIALVVQGGQSSQPLQRELVEADRYRRRAAG